MSPVRVPDWSQVGGSAGFTQIEDDLRPFFKNPRGLSAIPLGINRLGGNTGQIWDLIKHQGHGICFAPNSYGKSTSLVIPALMSCGGSMLVFCVKGELTFITADRRAAMGQRVIIYDACNEVENRFGSVPFHPTTWNPLSFINPKSDDYAMDVAALADGIVIKDVHENPHWPISAKNYLIGMIALAKEVYGLNGTFFHVRSFMNMPVAELKKYLDAAKRRFPDSLANRKLFRFLQSTDEIESVISTARAQASFLDDERLMKSMVNNNPIFNLDDFTRRPTTIFFVVPGNRLEDFDRPLRMMITLALRAITRNPEPAIPTMLLIDEAGVLGPLRCLQSAYGLYRSYGVRILTVYQSLSQVKDCFPTTFQHIVNNCSIVQVIGGTDPETTAYISEMLGTTTVRPPIKNSLLEMMEAPNPAYYYIMQEKKRLEQQGQPRPILYPHEVTALLGDDPTNATNTQLIMYRRGAKNVLSLQNPYFRDPRWRGMYRDPRR